MIPKGSAETYTQIAVQTTDLHTRATKEGSVRSKEHGTEFQFPLTLYHPQRSPLLTENNSLGTDSHYSHISFQRTLQRQMLNDQAEKKKKKDSLNWIVDAAAAAAATGANTAAGTVNGFSVNVGLLSKFFLLNSSNNCLEWQLSDKAEFQSLAQPLPWCLSGNSFLSPSGPQFPSLSAVRVKSQELWLQMMFAAGPSVGHSTDILTSVVSRAQHWVSSIFPQVKSQCGLACCFHSSCCPGDGLFVVTLLGCTTDAHEIVLHIAALGHVISQRISPKCRLILSHFLKPDKQASNRAEVWGTLESFYPFAKICSFALT